MNLEKDTISYHYQPIATFSTDCKPMRLKVNRAIRIDSDDPLIDGLPVHDAAEGIACPPPVYRLCIITERNPWMGLRSLLAYEGASDGHETMFE